MIKLKNKHETYVVRTPKDNEPISISVYFGDEEPSTEAKNNCENEYDEIYPLTIVRDRYNGVYSGGKYLAWHCEPYEVPDVIFSDDVSCSYYWGNVNPYLVGKGDTPKEALDDLRRKITS